MKPSKDITYYCFHCGAYTSVLHECFHGRGVKQISVKYGLQVPVCTECHTKIHGWDKVPEKGHKEKWQRIICDWLGVDYEQCRKSINNVIPRTYLEIYKDQCEEKIRSLEV